MARRASRTTPDPGTASKRGLGVERRRSVVVLGDHASGLRLGFTILEPLIVVVVIAILAATTIVSYTGNQQRTRESRVSLQLSQLRKEMELYRVEHDAWPFEDGIRACAGGTLAGRANCGTSSSSDTESIVVFFLRGYIADHDAASGAMGDPSSSGSSWTQTGISPAGEIQFCYGVAVDTGGMSSIGRSFFISSRKPGVSPRGDVGWCAR